MLTIPGNRATEDLLIYWRESARPLASLLLVAPILAFYELAILWQADMPHNAAEKWLRSGFRALGVGEQLALPVAVCALLFVAHGATHRPWTVRWSLLPAMICETLLGGVVLIAALQSLLVMTAILQAQGAAPSLSIDAGHWMESSRASRDQLAFVGSGIYEELFFRALLISPVAWTLQRLGETRRMSLLVAAVVSSLLFALAHYQALDIVGEDFCWFTFVFRTLAGGLFALLYIFRGFGITAGVHVAYDVMIASLAAV